MARSPVVEELQEIGLKLETLKEKQPNRYYEVKGRIDALYEKEMEQKIITFKKEKKIM